RREKACDDLRGRVLEAVARRTRLRWLATIRLRPTPSHTLGDKGVEISVREVGARHRLAADRQATGYVGHVYLLLLGFAAKGSGLDPSSRNPVNDAQRRDGSAGIETFGMAVFAKESSVSALAEVDVHELGSNGIVADKLLNGRSLAVCGSQQFHPQWRVSLDHEDERRRDRPYLRR